MDANNDNNANNTNNTNNANNANDDNKAPEDKIANFENSSSEDTDERI